MLKQINSFTVVFVGGDSFVDDTIETITKGNFSHTAIQILDGTLESLGIPDDGDRYPGVHLHDIRKYDNDPDAVFVKVILPNPEGAIKKAKELNGKFYSYIGCIEGGAYDIFGINIHPWIIKLANLGIFRLFGIPTNVDTGEWTMNCSETVSRILRAGGLNVCPGVDADCITPMDLYRELTNGN